MIDKYGTIDRDVDLRVRAAWSSWRKLTGVLYDRKIPLRLKAKVYEAIIRPAMTYGSDMKAKARHMYARSNMLRQRFHLCSSDVKNKLFATFFK